MKENIGAQIKKYRTLLNKSQEELADDLNVTANYVSLIENNKKAPGKAFLRDFSLKYEIPLLLFIKNELIHPGKNKEEREIEDKLHNIMGRLEELIFERIKNEGAE